MKTLDKYIIANASKINMDIPFREGEEEINHLFVNDVPFEVNLKLGQNREGRSVIFYAIIPLDNSGLGKYGFSSYIPKGSNVGFVRVQDIFNDFFSKKSILSQSDLIEFKNDMLQSLFSEMRGRLSLFEKDKTRKSFKFSDKELDTAIHNAVNKKGTLTAIVDFNFDWITEQRARKVNFNTIAIALKELTGKDINPQTLNVRYYEIAKKRVATENGKGQK